MAVAEFVCGRGKKSHTRRLGRLRRQLAAAAALMMVYLLNGALTAIVNYWGHMLGINIETDLPG